MSGYYGLEHPNPNVDQFRTTRRNGGKVTGTYIIHTAENYGDSDGPDGGAESVAAFISSRGAYGSYHDIVDSDSHVPYVPIAYEAWHESRTNNWSVGLSFACRTTDWVTKPASWVDAMIRQGAKVAAERIRKMKKEHGVDVPVKRISRAQALDRRPGFIGHGEIDTARRSDPGKAFPWAKFLTYVAEELGQPTDGGGGGLAKPEKGDLTVDGFNGPNSIERYQEILGTTADGIISTPSQFTTAMQKWLNAKGYRDVVGRSLEVDGLGFYQNIPVGNDTPTTNTQYALQRYLAATPTGKVWGYKPDGMFGSPSVGVKVMQTEANAGRLFR